MMFTRDQQLTEKNSFFLFGARNTGKSTLIKERFSSNLHLWVNLLNTQEESKYSMNPQRLYEEVIALKGEITHVVVDEIQKVPALLDIVHQLMFETQLIFILTGSSARKLRKAGVNLLAGRAFVFHLYPLAVTEMQSVFNLKDALHWGMLPSVTSYDNEADKRNFLMAYTQTYLKEEIRAEQIVRDLNPFRRFLEVAAQCNGKVINYANLAKDTGADDKTIKNYFSILEDTLIGYMLEPYRHSFRKRLSLKPKFYFFDVGVTRALAGYLTIPLLPSTSMYGEVFEHFIFLECYKLAEYHALDYRFSYVLTKEGAEIDLVVERPGRELLLIEIKSSDSVSDEKLSSFGKLLIEFDKYEAVCFSRDARKRKVGEITVFPWQEGLLTFFSR
jgi:uncharacterized protein